MDCGIDPIDYHKNKECYKKCGKVLECGHLCNLKCGECRKNKHNPIPIDIMLLLLTFMSKSLRSSKKN
jgi:hypothetical protein